MRRMFKAWRMEICRRWKHLRDTSNFFNLKMPLPGHGYYLACVPEERNLKRKHVEMDLGWTPLKTFGLSINSGEIL